MNCVVCEKTSKWLRDRKYAGVGFGYCSTHWRMVAERALYRHFEKCRYCVIDGNGYEVNCGTGYNLWKRWTRCLSGEKSV